MNRDIRKEILDDLRAVELAENVRILLAVESGSRAWGFASPDSDYDVRFIFVRREQEYLRLDPPRDVIEWKLDEVLDINGWDLRKALAALGKGNANIFEWANSPIVYRKAPEWDLIAHAATAYFSEKAALSHYSGTAIATLQTYLSGEQVRYKKYFYALRPILCCHWVSRFHEAPPVRFEKLLSLFDGTDPLLSEDILEAIRRLLLIKAKTEEKQLNPQIPEIIAFIQSECVYQRDAANRAPDDHNRDYSALNDVFFKTVRI